MPLHAGGGRWRRVGVGRKAGEVESWKDGGIGCGAKVEVALCHLGKDVAVRVVVIFMPKRLAGPVGHYREAEDRAVGGGCAGNGSADRFVELCRLVFRVELEAACPGVCVSIETRTEESVAVEHGAVVGRAVVDVER
jgi:hypothetical protein